MSTQDFNYKDPFDVREPEEQIFTLEKYSQEEVLAQRQSIEAIPLLKFFMDNIPQIILILNDRRQMVFGNKALTVATGFSDLNAVMGMRTGDILGCVHAIRSKEGCGSTQFCNHCGSYKVLLGSMAGGARSEECRFIRDARGENEAVDLRVSSAVFEHHGHKYFFFHITDISLEKRKKALERIFFHDILNAVGGVKGVLEITSETAEGEDKELLELALQQAVSVVEEIKAQKSLSAAEAHELKAKFERINSEDILRNVSSAYSGHPVGQDKKILIAPEADKVFFYSDPVLLSRVLGNMVKNALEASNAGDRIEIGLNRKNGKVVFWVKNSQIITEDVQLQIFKRSFSTKGSDRGLGTHSIKLLGEEYLKGKTWFVSDKEHGTVFYLELPIDTDELS